MGCSEERPVPFLGPPGSPSSHSSAGCSQAGWMSHAANCYVALGKSLAGTLTWFSSSILLVCVYFPENPHLATHCTL